MRILELAPPSAGAVTRYLGELGADVIQVPLSDLRDDPLAALTANTGKRQMALDLGSAAGRERLGELAASADILVHTRLDPRTCPIDTGDIAAFRAANPRLVVLSLSPFGVDGAYKDWQFTSSVIDALGGVLSRSGFPEREPLLPPSDVSLQCAWVQAAWIVLLAYFNRLRTGVGDFIDLSIVEAAAQAMDPGFGMGGSATAGKAASELPRGRPEARHQYPFFPCKDGHVRICVLGPRQWQNMFEWMGRPEKYASPEYAKLHVRFASTELLEDMGAFLASQSRAELEAGAERYGVPLAAVLTLDESIASVHAIARDATTQIADSDGRTTTLPNGVFEIDGARAGVGGAARPVGEDAGWLAAERFDPAPDDKAPERPLSGYTIIDFGIIVAGAEQSRLFADQGALTLKVESRAFPDGGRQSAENDPVPINFAMGHRNKKGLGINLRDDKGKALLKQLARMADIAMSNFKPGTLTALGLDHAALSAINPKIVSADSSAYGAHGPWSGRAGYGPLVRASSGICHLWSYPGTVGEFSDAMTVYPDHVCGRLTAIATLALLIRRLRTGRGGENSLAQSEVITAHLGTEVAALSRGEDRSRRLDAPWGNYPCLGSDEWCAVTVRNDADWQALATAIGRPDLLSDEALATTAGRMARADELDAAVSAWTSARTADEAMERLQAAGVPAGKMLRVFEMPDFPFFIERRSMRECKHPHIAHPFMMENSLAVSERIGEPDFGPAPVLGEHTEWVAREVLGLDQDMIDKLLDAGALESAAGVRMPKAVMQP